MPLLETLTLGLGPAFAKAVLKLWLPDHPLVASAGDGVVEIMKKRGENFATTDATDRLFRNLASEVAERLQKVVELEFPRLAEPDRDAAALAVADVLNKVELSSALMRAGLDAPGLEETAKLVAEPLFRELGGDSRSLAELILTEACSYAVAVAGKLPDFQVAATREILRRTAEIIGDLSRVLDAVGSMREMSGPDNTGAAFETKYRRSLSQRLDRMQLFGIRIVGSGAREPEISIAYVTLTSSETGSASKEVDAALAGKAKIVIRGEAGSGKTTLLRWLAIHAARRTFEDELAPWNLRIPFVVTLRDYADADYPPPETFVTKLVSNLSGLMPAGWTTKALDWCPCAHRRSRRGSVGSPRGSVRMATRADRGFPKFHICPQFAPSRTGC